MSADPAIRRHSLDPLLENAPCGFITFGDDGTVHCANRTLLEQLGYDAADVVGRHVEHVMTVGTRTFYQTHWFPMLRMHGRAEEVFLMLRSSSGEHLGMLVNAQRREEGGVSLYDCVFMRVVERQKYEEQLLHARKEADRARAEADRKRAEVQVMNEQLVAQTIELEQQQQQLHHQAVQMEHARAAAEEANRAKSTFLAVMSHELRTPLTAIAGYSELIEMGVQGPVTDSQRESLQRIRRSQRHLLRLVNEILNLARIEAGQVEYSIEKISTASLVADVAPMVEPQLRDKGQTFEASVSDDHKVLTDRDKTQQILLNLLSNAIKFTPRDGRITIRSDVDDDDSLVITVSDTGIGIPAAKLESIFDPFVQVNTSHSSRTEGSGLGLAISRDLARGMGGDLTAASVEGRGSDFALHLPAAVEPFDESGAAETPAVSDQAHPG